MKQRGEMVENMITQADLDEAADADEADDVKYVRPRRPREPSQVYSVRIPVSALEPLRKAAESAHVPITTYMRQAVLGQLAASDAARGAVPLEFPVLHMPEGVEFPRLEMPEGFDLEAWNAANANVAAAVALAQVIGPAIARALQPMQQSFVDLLASIRQTQTRERKAPAARSTKSAKTGKAVKSNKTGAVKRGVAVKRVAARAGS